MRIRRMAATAVAGALLGTALVATTAAPAAASFDLCTFTVTRVQAINIQENNRDEIYLQLNDQRFPNHGATDIEPGQTVYAAALGNPRITSSLPATIRLWERDVLRDEALGGFTPPCQARSESPVQIIRTANIEYIVWYAVTVERF